MMIRNLKISTRAYSREVEKRIARWNPNDDRKIISTFDSIEERDIELPIGYLKGYGQAVSKRLCKTRTEFKKTNE